jgi:hypothetical protein
MTPARRHGFPMAAHGDMPAEPECANCRHGLFAHIAGHRECDVYRCRCPGWILADKPPKDKQWRK